MASRDRMQLATISPEKWVVRESYRVVTGRIQKLAQNGWGEGNISNDEVGEVIVPIPGRRRSRRAADASSLTFKDFVGEPRGPAVVEGLANRPRSARASNVCRRTIGGRRRGR